MIISWTNSIFSYVTCFSKTLTDLNVCDWLTFWTLKSISWFFYILKKKPLFVCNPGAETNPSHLCCLSVNMPVCLALLNLSCFTVNSVVLPPRALLSAYFSPAANLWGADPLGPEVVMNSRRGNVYSSSVYTVNFTRVSCLHNNSH